MLPGGSVDETGTISVTLKHRHHHFAADKHTHGWLSENVDFEDLERMRKVVFIHRIHDFLQAGSPEKCMMLFICPHIRSEKSQLSNKQHFMSESAPLLSDSKPRCEARSLLKKTECAISADSSESFRRAFSLMFGNMWKAGTPGCHPMYSMFLLMSSLSVPTCLIVSFICSKVASSSAATRRDSQKSCFFTLRMRINIITDFFSHDPTHKLQQSVAVTQVGGEVTEDGLNNSCWCFYYKNKCLSEEMVALCIRFTKLGVIKRTVVWSGHLSEIISLIYSLTNSDTSSKE